MRWVKRRFTKTIWVRCADSISRLTPVFYCPWLPVLTPSNPSKMATPIWISLYSEKCKKSFRCSGVDSVFRLLWFLKACVLHALQRQGRTMRSRPWKSRTKFGRLSKSSKLRVKTMLRSMRLSTKPSWKNMEHAFIPKRSSMRLSKYQIVHSLWRHTRRQPSWHSSMLILSFKLHLERVDSCVSRTSNKQSWTSTLRREHSPSEIVLI